MQNITTESEVVQNLNNKQNENVLQSLNDGQNEYVVQDLNDGQNENAGLDLDNGQNKNAEQNENVGAQESKLPAEVFLEGYEFRMNVLSGKTEFRKRSQNDDNGEWCHFDKRDLNALTVEAQKAMPKATGVKQMLTNIIYSSATTTWSPIESWLKGLPAWDGRNRVTHLFSHIPGVTAEQLYWLSVWLRSTVAHWLQMDQMHANETVVTFIGEQGCGKSTFCRRLLPPHLREYYLDHVNLSNKNDKEMALTNNLIVNLDELDQIRPSQQAELKQMLSKVRVNGRPIYGSEQRDRDRYASFVATTNNRHPLRDRTGSRRYVCVEIEVGREIDNSFEIDYEQLYAQVMVELARGDRYWFDAEETRTIQRANVRYQNTLDLHAMIQTCYRLPHDGEYADPVTTDDILTCIGRAYQSVVVNQSTRTKVGIAMNDLGFGRKVGHNNIAYYAIPLWKATA